jgi:uncharacterized protein (DUF58 family)
VIKLGRSFWWLIILIGVSFTLTRIPQLANDPVYARLTVTLLIILVVNAIWAAFSLVGLDIIRKSRMKRKQVGEIFTENFEIHNQSMIPKIWLKITDQANLSGVAGSRIVTWLGTHQRHAYLAYSLLDRRGWFTLGPTKIESGDIFGLFLVQRTYESASRLLVLPYTVDIHAFPAPFGVLPGGRALRQKTLEVTPYAAGVREYVPGDPLKRIHWPSSARKQKLIVKEFEKDPLAEVWIFLDSQASQHFQLEEPKAFGLREYWWVKYSWIKKAPDYVLPPDTEEYAISIAASLAKYYIGQNREVGLVSAGQNYSILPAERGERQLGKILETLAVIQAEGEIPLWQLVNSQIGHLARGTTIILLTPSNDEKIFITVVELIQRGLMPVVILIDQASFGGEGDASLLELKLNNHGILNFVISEGDTLKTALETPQYLLDERMIYHKS